MRQNIFLNHESFFAGGVGGMTDTAASSGGTTAGGTTTSTSVEVPASGRVTGTTSLRSKSSHL